MRMIRLFLLVSLLSMMALAKVQYSITPDMQKFTASTGGAIYTLFYPATVKRFGAEAPLIFFIGGSEGGIWTKDDVLIRDLRYEGYHVVTVGYFKMKGLPEATSKIDLEPFIQAIDYYKKYPGVDSDRIGLLGGSKGGELALLLGSMDPDIHLVAGFVVSNVAFQGTDIAIFSHHSSWRYRGKEIPFVPYPQFSWAAIKGVLSGENYREMHDLALENTEAVDRALIEVERINGPVFLLSSRHDQFWPSMEMSHAIMKRLDRYRFPYVHKHIAWDSNHFVLKDPKAWKTILSFLREQWQH